MLVMKITVSGYMNITTLIQQSPKQGTTKTGWAVLYKNLGTEALEQRLLQYR